MMCKPATPAACDLFREGAIALAQASHNGLRVDVPYLEKTIKRVGNKIALLEDDLRKDDIFKTWRKRYGDRTKLRSREQLGEVVFGMLGMKSAGYTEGSKDKDKKRYRTDGAAFDHLRDKVPFIDNFLEFEKWHKVKGTYLKGILRETVDGLLHCNFNLHVVKSFRSSSSEINFQNFPIRDPELGEVVRKAFIARDGHLLGENDLSGAEVRTTACITKDPRLIKYILDPKNDMHRDLACQIWMITPDMVEPAMMKRMRQGAKGPYVFASFYGSVYFQTAPDLWDMIDKEGFKLKDGTPVKEHLRKKGITHLGHCDPQKGDPVKGSFEHHIREIDNDFWNHRFKVYGQWKKDFFAAYQKDGGFWLPTGFRVEGLYKKNDVTNYPSQGSAFHCLLWAFIKIQKWLNKYKMRTKLVGQIHDSILADIHEKELQDYLSKVYEIFTVDLPKHWDWIIVPIVSETDVAPAGKSWFHKQPWARDASGRWAPEVK